MVDGSALQVKDKRRAEQNAEPTRKGTVFVPAVDIYETRDALVLVADMPGVGNDDVEIHLQDNELSIRGKVEGNEPEGSLLHSEYETGDYLRSFSLSGIIDQEQIEANMKDGVLRIVLPKAGAAKPRQIQVKAG